MIAIETIVAGLAAVTNNLPAMFALGVDVYDVFEKGKDLVTSHVASTADERAAALAEIAGLQAQRDAALTALGQQAPNS